jgi:hypothetical protein
VRLGVCRRQIAEIRWTSWERARAGRPVSVASGGAAMYLGTDSAKQNMLVRSSS